MATGMRSTYTQTTNIKRGIAPLIDMIDWVEAPLLRLLGVNGGSKFNILDLGTKIEWQQDTMSPSSDLINEALDNSETAVDVVNGAYFRVGHVVKVDSELMNVTAVSSNTLTVTRGASGSTAATHTDQTPIYIHGIAKLEGADAVTGHTTTTTLPYNYSQIFEEAVKVSRSEQRNPKYGITDTLSRHIAKLIGGGEGIGTKGKAGTMAIMLEKTFWHGMRYIGTDAIPRTMDGFNAIVTTNVLNAAGDPLTRKMIEDKMQACYLAGGSPETILCGAWAQRKLSSFYEKYITTERSEERGGYKIKTLETDFGDLEIVFSKHAPTDELSIIEKDKMGWVELRPFDVVDLPSSGDYDWKDVIGEYSFVCKTETAHARIHSFSTSL